MRKRTVRKFVSVMAAGTIATASIVSCSPPTKKASPAALVEQPSTSDTTPKSAPQEQPSAHDLPQCSATQLSPMIDSSQTGAGTTVNTVRLTNTGADCSVYGYPGVSLIDADGEQIGAAADRDSSDKPESVILEHNTAVHFRLRSSNALAFDPNQCQPSEAARSLKIFPPNNTDFITVPINLSTCSNPAVVTLTVGAVHR